MNAAELIRFLLELDQQWLTSRPSPCGKAAELVATLCEHAEPSLRDPKLLGDWRSVDVSAARRPAPRELSQPTLERINSAEQAIRERDAIRTLCNRLEREHIGLSVDLVEDDDGYRSCQCEVADNQFVEAPTVWDCLRRAATGEGI